jgi:hypothetical protein
MHRCIYLGFDPACAYRREYLFSAQALLLCVTGMLLGSLHIGFPSFSPHPDNVKRDQTGDGRQLEPNSYWYPNRKNKEENTERRMPQQISPVSQVTFETKPDFSEDLNKSVFRFSFYIIHGRHPFRNKQNFGF